MEESRTNMRSPDNRPFGVPLDELLSLLSESTLKATRVGDGLLVQHEKFATDIRVLPPPKANSNAIRAVVEIRSDLPQTLLPIFERSGEGAAFNSMATLGAITHENGRYFVGSRLTIFEQEDAWNIHLPLLLFTIIGAADTLLGAMHRVFSGNGEARPTRSSWTESNFKQVESTLSQLSVCTTGGLGLTAEFGLESGQFSSLAGHQTALWQLSAGEPHPEMGGGLFCLLQMPQHFDDDSRLHEILGELNRLEMTADDLPPHFGAWCPGKSGNNPAYISFLPNAMHEVPGIATNFSIWAMHRAEWAGRTLKILNAKTPQAAAHPANPIRSAPAPSQPSASQAAASPGRSYLERLNLTRGILGYGLADEKLIEIAKTIEVQLAGKPKVLLPRDVEAIIQPIRERFRSVLYSQLELLIEALHRPITRL